MNNFWEDRYKSGGNSGSGSYGEYAKHKSEVINNYIKNFEIKTISDFGCGDGNQISAINGYEKYCGYDISPFIIEKCKKIFSDNEKMSFVNKINELPISDLCLSLDVVYHIVNDDEFNEYMNALFDKSSKYVLIYSSNHDNNNHDATYYIKHRTITEWIKNNILNFEFVEVTDNFLLTSARFYLYKRI